MKPIFVDSWAWYALVDRRDVDHQVAVTANRGFVGADRKFLTTNFVFGETITLIRYKLNHETALQFQQIFQEMVNGNLLEFVRVSEAHERVAWQIFEKYQDQRFSYVDCTSFAVMRDLGLDEAFTRDNHFATMGFRRVPA